MCCVMAFAKVAMQLGGQRFGFRVVAGLYSAGRHAGRRCSSIAMNKLCARRCHYQIGAVWRQVGFSTLWSQFKKTLAICCITGLSRC